MNFDEISEWRACVTFGSNLDHIRVMSQRIGLFWPCQRCALNRMLFCLYLLCFAILLRDFSSLLSVSIFCLQCWEVGTRLEWLLVGRLEEHLACESWVLVHWLWWFEWSFARFKKFQWSPLPPPSLLSVAKSRRVWNSDYCLLRLFYKQALKHVFSCSCCIRSIFLQCFDTVG